MTASLEGHIALVTGASRGLGRAIALALAEAGASVGVNYQHSRDQAEEVCEGIRRMGRKAVALRADVSMAADVQRMFRELEAGLGDASILVNNAGIARPQKIEEITEADWDQLIAVNLKSVFLVTQAALPAMRVKKFGRIINLSSVAAQSGGVVGAHYAASKAGIVGLTHYCASLLSREGITVNAISPALIETDMVAGNPNAVPERIPVGRLGEPQEVADVAVLLATNGYITGQTIGINGGWYMTS